LHPPLTVPFVMQVLLSPGMVQPAQAVVPAMHWPLTRFQPDLHAKQSCGLVQYSSVSVTFLVFRCVDPMVAQKWPAEVSQFFTHAFTPNPTNVYPVLHAKHVVPDAHVPVPAVVPGVPLVPQY
jgi:hypothetical protein